jgi:hypothetical protein
MDTVLFLESIMHLYNYVCSVLLHTDGVSPILLRKG